MQTTDVRKCDNATRAWRITDYHWKSKIWVVLFFVVAFIILPTIKSIFLLFIHLVVTIAKLLGPGGAKAIVADSLLMKQQLLIIRRSRLRAPRLTATDRFSLAFWTLFLIPRQIERAAVILRPSTLLAFHARLTKCKYRQLFSFRKYSKPGPKGPSQQIIDAVIEMKRRNPSFGCPRIALQGVDNASAVDDSILARTGQWDPLTDESRAADHRPLDLQFAGTV